MIDLVSGYDALLAGMPSPVLVFTELGKRRAEELSFFVFAFLVCGFLVKLLWNYVFAGVAWAPQLTYARALGALSLWGLVMVVVLSLVSGARELMTPAAWEPNGTTHRLAKPSEQSLAASQQAERKTRIEKVRFALWDFAAKHQGQLPTIEQWNELPVELRACEPSGTILYRYEPGATIGSEAKVIVFEPRWYDDQYVLYGDGSIALQTKVSQVENTSSEGVTPKERTSDAKSSPEETP